MTHFNPDFGKAGFARHLFRLRFRDLKLSQRAFAERFGLPYSVVRDAEQGAKPSRALRVLVAAIACNPDLIEAAGRLAAMPCRCSEGDAYRCCALDEIPGEGNFPMPTRARARAMASEKETSGTIASARDAGRIGKVPDDCRNADSTRARDALRAFLATGPVKVQRLGPDRYGRMLARVTVNGRDAGEYLIRLGLARRWR